MLASLCPEDDILLAAPVHNRQQLADIARMFSQRPLRSALRAASGTKQVSQLLCEYAG